ncbi:MAG: phosphatidate cytidylyltransferase [Calditrichae bacterium]|nr:phosphatidate cytidylyltransferase [Calditrichota bacterium]MCB9057360.1 phosphatidate cytidylyltransferase [Calditrichia bacterium]
MKELLLRVAVAIIGIPLLVFLIWKGGWYFFALILIISLAGQYEFYILARQKESYALIFPGFILTVIIHTLSQIGYNRDLTAMALAVLIIMFAYEMFRNKESAFLNTSATMVGVVYPGIFLAPLLVIRNNAESMGISSAFGYIVTIFIAIWACDTFAYFIGKAIGKHRLFERVSPKKSIEGAVAGLVGAIAVFLVVFYFDYYTISLSLALISGLIVGVFGQLGDLVESWFKRDAAMKDSSHILPGHGGFLDRFDSLIFIVPAFMIVYLLWS